MSDLTIAVTFTKSGGQPATGLALADINIYLTAQNRATNVDTVVWNTQNPTAEMDNVGAYSRIYSAADLNTYNYFAAAQYVGATVLDSNWAVGSVGLENIPIGTAIQFTYTVTNVLTGIPIEGVQVWFSTNATFTNIVWAGTTDVFGVARDDDGNLPLLDPGTYHIRCQKSGYTFTDDSEVVS